MFGALAVALAMLVIVARTGDRERAHTTAALLLVALPVWWAATIAETYTAALALVLGGALAAGRGERLRAWRWLVAGALWGLGVAVPALACSSLRRSPWSWAGARRGDFSRALWSGSRRCAAKAAHIIPE